MKAKKRKLDTLDSSEKSEETESPVHWPHSSSGGSVDAFTTRFGFSLTHEQCEQLKKLKSQRPQRNFNLPSLGAVVEYAGVVEETSWNNDTRSPSEIGWSESLVKNFENEEDIHFLSKLSRIESLLLIYREHNITSQFVLSIFNIGFGRQVRTKFESKDYHQSDFLNIITQYMDLYAQPSPKCYSYRTVYLAHALNHVIQTRNLVISNNRKLELASAKGLPPDDLVESTRDQGFVRPTVLILCPFKKDAFDIVHRLERLIFGKEGKGSIWNRDRFNTEFKSEEAPPFKTRMSEEFKDLITGNNDDCFRVGIALSKKVLKLYEAFDKSDFILCSPLGLRMILDGEAGKESHLISSIQLAVIDKADIMLQQNWEHLTIIFSHMHAQPSKIDTDISRVRQCYVDGQTKFYCQLLLFSRYRHELFSALMLEHSLNYKGLVMQNSVCEGTLDKIEIPLCQEFRRFDVADPSEQAVARFDCFKDYCSASLSPGTCLVIPSYFDFVRVRNYFKRMEESFVACQEYAPKTKITRARDLFFHKTKKVLIVTERYYYFNRRPLRGIGKIVFYQLPSHPDLYSEFINMGDSEAETRFSSVLFYCKYDRIRLQNTFGTDMANSVISSSKKVQAIVSESIMRQVFALILLMRGVRGYLGPMMGVQNNCDDGKTNLIADWNPSDFSVFTCMGDPYPVLQDLDPIINDLKGRNASFDPKKDVVYHKCMSEKIEYYDSPPLRGDHRPNWARYGEYLYVPEQRWLHNLEHGSIILLYHPCANHSELEKLRHLVTSCLYRHIITPYKKLKHDRPLALISWGVMMGMSSVNETSVVDFIKEHARRAPEDISKNGVYDWYLIRPADTVSDEMDNDLCPGL